MTSMAEGLRVRMAPKSAGLTFARSAADSIQRENAVIFFLFHGAIGLRLLALRVECFRRSFRNDGINWDTRP